MSELTSLQKQIIEEKQKRDTVILAHTYQSPEIIDIADIKGDSFALSKAAAKLENSRIIMCGVRFMAETVKILSPDKTVIQPVAEATCPMAEQITPERVAQFKAENPDAVVVAYINTTAALKAECDICVTSSSAVKIVSKIDAPKILFIPDKNLGAWTAAQLPEKNIITWDGFCPVHNSLTLSQALRAKQEHPDALLAVHPECIPEVTAAADMVGSTAAIAEFALNSEKPVIIGTERGVADYLIPNNPDKKIYYLAPETLVCRDMKYTTIQSVFEAVVGKGGEEVTLEEDLRIKAKRCIDEMLRLG